MSRTCTECGHARVSHGQDGSDCRTCPDYDRCDGYDSNVEVDREDDGGTAA